MKKSNQGFSLVELIVVIAIMAVLVGILAPTLIRYVEKARVGKDEAAMGEFLNALYLAATDLDAYDDIAANETFSCAANSNTFNVKMNASNETNSFREELAACVGDTIKFSSKRRQAASITVVVDPVWDSITVRMNPADLMTNYSNLQELTPGTPSNPAEPSEP